MFTIDGECGVYLSNCGTYRYALWRVWDWHRPRVVWVMLNPSTADHTRDDPTIRRCIGFARAWDAGGIIVVNIFAARATDPRQLARFSDPVGLLNDRYLRDMLREDRARVVCAWGAHTNVREHAGVVRDMAQAAGKSLYCLGTTKDGHPRHPLYIAASTPLVLFA